MTDFRATLATLYDELHFGRDNLFTGNPLARRLVLLIEQRHPKVFNGRVKAVREVCALCEDPR